MGRTLAPCREKWKTSLAKGLFVAAMQCVGRVGQVAGGIHGGPGAEILGCTSRGSIPEQNTGGPLIV